MYQSRVAPQNRSVGYGEFFHREGSPQSPGKGAKGEGFIAAGAGALLGGN